MHLTRAHVLCTNKHRLPSESTTCLLNLYIMGATWKEIRLRQANMTFNTQNEDMDRCTYNQMYNFTYVFLHIYHVK